MTWLQYHRHDNMVTKLSVNKMFSDIPLQSHSKKYVVHLNSCTKYHYIILLMT